MKWLCILLVWPLLTSVAPRPAPLVATLHTSPVAAPAHIVVRRMPVLPRPQEVVVALPASLPQPPAGCTRENASYYLEAKVDGGLRGTASAWSCRSLEEANEYLKFHIGLVTQGR